MVWTFMLDLSACRQVSARIVWMTKGRSQLNNIASVINYMQEVPL